MASQIHNSPHLIIGKQWDTICKWRSRLWPNNTAYKSQLIFLVGSRLLTAFLNYRLRSTDLSAQATGLACSAAMWQAQDLNPGPSIRSCVHWHCVFHSHWESGFRVQRRNVAQKTHNSHRMCQTFGARACWNIYTLAQRKELVFTGQEMGIQKYPLFY